MFDKVRMAEHSGGDHYPERCASMSAATAGTAIGTGTGTATTKRGGRLRKIERYFATGSIVIVVVMMGTTLFTHYHVTQQLETGLQSLDKGSFSLSPVEDMPSGYEQRAPTAAAGIPSTSSQSDYRAPPPPSSSWTSIASEPKFLWGIPTIANSPKERRMRAMIRATYMSYYKNDPHQKNRICSLADLQAKRVSPDECQLAYVFFMGSNPGGPTQLLHPNASFPMLYNATGDLFDVEDDVARLNIKENQFDGKMHTWFKYASMVVEDGYHFDYIAKVDSDTLLFTPNFFRYASEHFPAHPHNVRVYGGLPLKDTSCNVDEIDDHPCPLPLVGPVYMSGELSFMSPDLASFITSDQCDRESVTISHEDVSLSNYVFLHPKNVTIKLIKHEQVLRQLEWRYRWRHGMRIDTRVGFQADWHVRFEPYSDCLWGHSVSSSGAYFKKPSKVTEAWAEFYANKHPRPKLYRMLSFYISVIALLSSVVLLIRMRIAARRQGA